MAQTGTISEWNREQGSGYLVSEGRRLSLYLSDFKEPRPQPGVGAVVRFVEGIDKWGKPCVCRAVVITVARGNEVHGLKLVHFSILLLLVLPGLAFYRLLGPRAVCYAAVWVVIVSWCTYHVYADDKRRARTKDQREPEKTLHFLEFFGGWPGAFFAQRRLRHKSSKDSYQFGFMLIIVLHQFVAIDALRGWTFAKQLLHLLDSLGE